MEKVRLGSHQGVASVFGQAFSTLCSFLGQQPAGAAKAFSQKDEGELLVTSASPRKLQGPSGFYSLEQEAPRPFTEAKTLWLE